MNEDKIKEIFEGLENVEKGIFEGYKLLGAVEIKGHHGIQTMYNVLMLISQGLSELSGINEFLKEYFEEKDEEEEALNLEQGNLKKRSILELGNEKESATEKERKEMEE